MPQIVVSARFKDYYIQLITSKDSTIRQLVQSLRQQNFIPQSVSGQSLVFSNKKLQILSFESKIQSIIINQNDEIHSLEIETNPSILHSPPASEQANDQILISVRFQGYYLELLMKRNSSIKELVVAMKQNKFIPQNTSDDRIIALNNKKEVLKVDSKIQSAIINQNDAIHVVEIQVVGQIPPHTQETIGIFEVQVNRILQRIDRYLKEGNYQSLLRAKQNPRIQQNMAHNLSSIGQSFHKLQMENQFYQKSFEMILSSLFEDKFEDKSFEGIKEKYLPFLNASAAKTVEKVVQSVQKLKQLKKETGVQEN